MASNLVASTPSPTAGVGLCRNRRRPRPSFCYRTLRTGGDSLCPWIIPKAIRRAPAAISFSPPVASRSIAVSSLLSSMFTKTRLSHRLRQTCGLPFSLIVPTTVSLVASMAVASWLRPLNVNTHRVPDRKIRVGALPDLYLATGGEASPVKNAPCLFRVLVKPRPNSGARAMP